MGLPWEKEYKEFEEDLKNIQKVQEPPKKAKKHPAKSPQYYSIAAILPKNKKAIEKKTTDIFQEKWINQLKPYANIKLTKLGTPDSSYALATLAYEERLFGAIRSINSYKDRIPDFPKNGFSITTAKPCELDDSDASAGTNIYGIKFTPRKTVRENLNPSVKEGWCQPSRMDNPPIIACDAAHEYGHVIDLAITCQLYDKFYPEDAGKAFVSYKYEMLFGLVARVRAQKLKEATKLESGAKLKDTRILENDPKMVKGMSGYAHSQPAEFNAENLVRVTLSEKDSPDDILAIKTRAYLDQGLSGMAQDIEQTIKDEKLFEAHKSYYSKGFTGDLRTNAITPELLKQLDPKYV